MTLGISERIRKLRYSTEYKEWKKRILVRDKRKCVLCGSSKEIEVDHIKSLALFPELSLKEDNGRVLCKDCHKKTDTYGSLSRFKGETPVHPILSGDLLYRIQTFPTYIERGEKKIGFSLFFNPDNKKWNVGYRNKKTDITVADEKIESCIDGLFDKLRTSTFYKVDIALQRLEKKRMRQSSTKELRKELYTYIELLLGRELTGVEKGEIHNLFVRAVRNFAEEKILTANSQ